MEIGLTATGLGKTFNRRVIFENISFSLRPGHTLLVTGRNGSGKSTLVKILSGLVSPGSGRVGISTPRPCGPLQRLMLVGFVAPYLQLYEEFSARENLILASHLRGIPADEAAIDALLASVTLSGRTQDLVRTFSSGMKQRVKYAVSLIHHPPILILDEPMANLDAEGCAMVRRAMHAQRERGILVVATNEHSDVDHYDEQVDLDAIR